MGRAIDMQGYETEHARVIGRASSSATGSAMWAMECHCGKVFRAAGNDIRRRPNMSCGCRGKTRLKAKDSPAVGVCRIASCDNKPVHRGLCMSCHDRASRAGVVDEVALPAKANGYEGSLGEAHPTYKGTQTEGQRGYNRTHHYLNRERGRAANHPCAENCGRQAEHWSYDGYCPKEQFGNATNDAKPWCPHLHHYQPRCVSCHDGWDVDQDYVAEVS